MMRTIETRATVRPDGTLVAQVPPDVASGEHRVILMLQETVATATTDRLELPVHDLGPWPDTSLRREDLHGAG
jgi:hypothetical protein